MWYVMIWSVFEVAKLNKDPNYAGELARYEESYYYFSCSVLRPPITQQVFCGLSFKKLFLCYPFKISLNVDFGHYNYCFRRGGERSVQPSISFFLNKETLLLLYLRSNFPVEYCGCQAGNSPQRLQSFHSTIPLRSPA